MLSSLSCCSSFMSCILLEMLVREAKERRGEMRRSVVLDSVLDCTYDRGDIVFADGMRGRRSLKSVSFMSWVFCPRLSWCWV